MIFERANRTNPEVVKIVVKNSYSTASLSAGQVVGWDTTAKDGKSVTKPSAGKGGLGAGRIDETIAYGDYGLMQTFGYCSDLRVRSATSAAPTIAAGSPLGITVAAFCAEPLTSEHASNATVPVQYPFAIALSAYTLYTTTTLKAMIRAM